MRAKGGKIRYILQLACIVLLVALIAIVVVSETSRVTMALQRDTAAVTSLPLTVDGVGYVFRDELPVTSVDNGVIEYYAANGATVATGTPLAKVYADGANVGTRETAKRLYEELWYLESLDRTDLPDYYGSYAALMAALSSGALAGTGEAVDTVKAALAQKAAGSEDAAVRAARCAELRAELDRLIENDRNAANTVYAPTGGVFYREADGYEALFSTNAVESLTPGGLRTLLATVQNTALTVGKLVLGGSWYLAVPMSAAEAANFAVGADYEISLQGEGSFTFTLQRVTDPDAAGEVLLVLCAKGELAPRGLARCYRVTLTYGSAVGLQVPSCAIFSEADVLYVYVEKDGVATRRRIDPLLYRDGCCIAAVTEDAACLREGDVVISSPRRLYEGKATV